MIRNARGSMLVMAMWALTLLAVFSLSLGLGVRQKAALLSRLSALDAVYPIAYSGVEEAKSLLKSDDNFDVDTLSDLWAVGERKAAFGSGSFSLLTDGPHPVVDEERKVNLNYTNVQTVSRLLEGVSGLAKEDANELAYNLIDWVDADSGFGHPQFGAEERYYTNLKDPYAAKNAPCDSLDELLLVKGMTPEIFSKIRPYVTVHGSGKVNLNTAPREVLSALGFSAQGVESIVRYRAGRDGAEGTNDDLHFKTAASVENDIKSQTDSPLDVSQVGVLSGLLSNNSVGVASRAFSVNSRAELPSGATLAVEAVFDRKGRVLYHRAGEVQWPARN